MKELKIVNKEDWEKVKNLLPYSRINIKIDNYNVNICCEPYKPLHFHYMIYIDEHWKMAWLTEDCEIRKRFCQKHQKSMLSASDRKKIKREKKAVREAVEEKMMYYYYNAECPNCGNYS